MDVDAERGEPGSAGGGAGNMMVTPCGRGASVQGQTNGPDAPVRQARPGALQEVAAITEAAAHP
eukprot:14688502-Alexandrium_andersonii.AAC.1